MSYMIQSNNIYKPPFIWDNTDIFDEYIINNQQNEQKENKTPISKWTLHPDNRKRINKYNSSIVFTKTNTPVFEYDSINEYGVIYGETYITKFGTLIHKKDHFTNGGCRCGAFTKEELTLDEECYAKTEHPVVSITGYWSSGIWHFPYESFIALCSIPTNILQQSIIHVHTKNSYSLDWLSYLGIRENQVVGNHIKSMTKTYFPRMGKCGNPYVSHIYKIKELIETRLTLSEDFRCVVIIRRRVNRCSKNFGEFYHRILSFSKSIDLPLYIHDDVDLPTLQQQQQIFHYAKYVFAPHGAAGIHIPAMKHGAEYIEFLDEGLYFNLCYSRLAYWCNISYTGLPMNNDVIDIVALDEFLAGKKS